MVISNGELVTRNGESAIEMLYLTKLENCYDYIAERGINPGGGLKKNKLYLLMGDLIVFG
ncbi:hypothetical protein QUB08_04825 [Microcoleus sp. BR0-C5]|uniref:hypothetical protein n=1 Tax=Microcoleus sp. BR0-C5 TaxID=2818713 RepID=UPI002FD063DB